MNIRVPLDRYYLGLDRYYQGTEKKANLIQIRARYEYLAAILESRSLMMIALITFKSSLVPLFEGL